MVAITNQSESPSLVQLWGVYGLMPAFPSSAIRNVKLGPLPKHCPSLLDLVCPSEGHLRYLEAELGRSMCWISLP